MTKILHLLFHRIWKNIYIFDKTKFRIIPVFLNIISLWISVGKNGQAKTFRVFLIDFKITELSLNLLCTFINCTIFLKISTLCNLWAFFQHIFFFSFEIHKYVMQCVCIHTYLSFCKKNMASFFDEVPPVKFDEDVFLHVIVAHMYVCSYIS